MIITCPACSANYRLREETIDSVSGRVVRCSACGNNWRVFPTKRNDYNTKLEDNKTNNDETKGKLNFLLWSVGIVLFNSLLFFLGYIFQKEITKVFPQIERFYQIFGISSNVTGISLIMPYLEKVKHTDGHVSLLIQGSFLNSHPKKTLKIQPLFITLLDDANLPIKTFVKSEFNPKFLLSGGRTDFTYEIKDLPNNAVDVRIEIDTSKNIDIVN
jgi:predicted Zn finger-like uncharacterized protein